MYRYIFSKVLFNDFEFKLQLWYNKMEYRQGLFCQKHTFNGYNSNNKTVYRLDFR